ALQDRVEIHLGQQVTLVVDLLPRDLLEIFEQGLGLLPSMGLDDADDDIDPFAPDCLGRLKHLVGLTDPRCRAEKNLQSAASLLSGRFQQRLRGRPSFSLRHGIIIMHPRWFGTSQWCIASKLPAKCSFRGVLAQAIASWVVEGQLRSTASFPPQGST